MCTGGPVAIIRGLHLRCESLEMLLGWASSETTHITEAAPAETRQEVFGHQDHEGLHMHVHRTSKMCRGPRFLFPKHMMLNSRLHTPAVSII